MKNIVWQNNKWNNAKDIYLSIKDRGLRFGDGVFETILIKRKKPILLAEHLQRMNNSIKMLYYQNEPDMSLIQSIIREGIKKLGINNDQYGSIRINFSRGLNIDRSIKANQANIESNLNNLWIEFYIIDINLSSITTHISQSEKINEKSLLSKCKTFCYSQSIQALIEANNKDFDDSLLLNTSGELCCGSTFNLILRRNNKWITPRKASGCLPGIMINQLLKLKLVEEDYIVPEFQRNDILIAINSLFCKQIRQVNDIEFLEKFDPKYYWDLLYI